MLPYIYSIARECCETGPSDDARAVAASSRRPAGRRARRSISVGTRHPGLAGRRKGRDVPPAVSAARRLVRLLDEERIGGGREIDRPVDLATMPLHVRAGAMLPFGPVKQYADELIDQPLSLVVYPGANGEFTLYEDDGRTFNYRRGEWMGIEMRWRDAEKRLTLQLAPGARMMPPLRREIDVRIAGDKSSRRLVFTGRPLTETLPVR